MTPEQQNLETHLAKIEELADAFASPDGSEIVIARSKGLPPQMGLAALKEMRRVFCLGALVATGLLWPDDADIPDEWLKRNDVPQI